MIVSKLSRLIIIVIMVVLTATSIFAARLPVNGSDNSTWGIILNDFLNVSLDENGSLDKGLNASFYNFNVTNNLIISNDLVSTGNINTSGIVNASAFQILGQNIYSIFTTIAQAFTLGNYSAEYANSGYKKENLTLDYPLLDTDSSDDLSLVTLTNDTIIRVDNTTWVGWALQNDTINRSISLDGYNKSVDLSSYNQSVDLSSYYNTEGQLTALLDNNYLALIGGTLTGNLIINGNLTILGDEIQANVTTQNLNGTFLPSLNNQFDIGSSSLLWSNVYATTLYGDWDGSSEYTTVAAGMTYENITTKWSDIDLNIVDDFNWVNNMSALLDNATVNRSVDLSTYFTSTQYPNLDTDSTDDLDLTKLDNGTVVRTFNTTFIGWAMQNDTINRSISLDGYNKSVDLSGYNYSLDLSNYYTKAEADAADDTVP